jgi:uncharacterized protein YjiS (DUF1127 family)
MSCGSPKCTASVPAIIAPATAPIAATVRSALRAALSTLTDARARRRQRQALHTLDDRLLEDIGITREQADAEAAKPFWRR